MSKFLSTTAWVLGATATSAALSEPASAVAISCNASVTSQGNSSISTPTDVGSICNATTFSVNQPTTPAYWEFTWTGTNDPLNIHSTATTTSFVVGGEGSFYGTLSLYDSSAHLLASSQYENAGSFFPDFPILTTEADIDGFSFDYLSQYILGIEPPTVDVDPALTIGFAAATPVPEPATTGIVGGGLALLGLLRRRRRKTH